jgi:hypothetical protein
MATRGMQDGRAAGMRGHSKAGNAANSRNNRDDPPVLREGLPDAVWA